MSFQITTSFVQEYKTGIETLVQQRGSKLRNAVRVETQIGKAAYYDQVDATTVRKRTVRHGDSPYIETPHARRQVVLEDYDWGDFVDDEDKIRTLNDPTNAYVQAASFAMGRAQDQAIVDAAFGTAKTGEAGGTSLILSADATPSTGEEGYTIVHGSARMSIAKLLTAKEILDDNEVDEEEPRYCAMTATQFSALLLTTEVTSADFNTVKALVAGKIDTFLGFKFIRLSSDILPVASTIRDCLCWAHDGLLLSVGSDIDARITERGDKGFSTYAFASMSIGASRMQGKKVIKIQADEP